MQGTDLVSDTTKTSPAESMLLKAAYKKSGLTVADLAAASGLSVGTLHLAFTGYRYREGAPRVTPPADQTLVKLGSVLRLNAEALRSRGPNGLLGCWMTLCRALKPPWCTHVPT